jgi:hypothetical protein
MDDCGCEFNLEELKGEVGNMSRSAFCSSFEDRNSTLGIFHFENGKSTGRSTNKVGRGKHNALQQ